MKETSQTARLTLDELKKCGIQTQKQCFALSIVPEGPKCLGVEAQQGGRKEWLIFLEKSGNLKSRRNIDPNDGKAWCPKGILINSKK